MVMRLPSLPLAVTTPGSHCSSSSAVSGGFPGAPGWPAAVAGATSPPSAGGVAAAGAVANALHRRMRVDAWFTATVQRK